MLCNLSKHNTTYTIQIQTLSFQLIGELPEFVEIDARPKSE